MSLDTAVLILCLGVPMVVCVIGLLLVGNAQKHLREMREMQEEFRQQRQVVRDAMRRGARATDHRMKL